MLDFFNEFFTKNDPLTVGVVFVWILMINLVFIIFSHYLVEFIKEGVKKNLSVILVCVFVLFTSEFIAFIALKFEIFKFF